MELTKEEQIDVDRFKEVKFESKYETALQWFTEEEMAYRIKGNRADALINVFAKYTRDSMDWHITLKASKALSDKYELETGDTLDVHLVLALAWAEENQNIFNKEFEEEWQDWEINHA